MNRLATALEAEIGVVRQQTQITLELLNRNSRDTEAAGIALAVGDVEVWGLDTGAALRWRANAIRSGQSSDPGVFDLTRTRSAGEAVFVIADVAEAYRRWLTDRQASRQRIADALTAISRWLGQSWSDWDVTNNDLHNIFSTLDPLSAAELDQVVRKLSPAQLRRWITEMSNGINGFSRSEKREVFAMLAANASGQSLGRVHDAIVNGAMSEEAEDLGVAIRTHATDQSIVDFVQYAIDQNLARNRYSAVAPALAAGGVEGGTAIDTMMRGIVAGEGAIELFLVDSLVTAHLEDTGRSCIEIDPWESLVDAMTRGTDAALIADVFVSIARSAVRSEARFGHLLQSRHGIPTPEPKALLLAAENLLEDATRLMATDANGVVAQLATRLDTNGSLTTDFLHHLVTQDQIGQLGTLIRQLRGGEGVDIAAFSHVGANPDYPYPHAQNLGFFAASLRGALERYADDSKGDVSAIASGAQAIGSVVALFYTASLKSLQAAAGLIGWGAENLGPGRAAADTSNNIDTHLARVVEAIETSLQPQRSGDISPPTLGDAMWAWDDRYDLVLGQ